MKKRFVALAMMAVLTVGMIAGCGNGDGGSGDSGNTDAGNNTDAGSQTQQTPEQTEAPADNAGDDAGDQADASGEKEINDFVLYIESGEEQYKPKPRGEQTD